MIGRSVRICIAFTALLTAASCASVASGDGHPVEWFDAFALGEVLAEPSDTRDLEDVKLAMAAPWYGPVAVTNRDGEAMTLASCEAYLQVQHQHVRPDDPTYWVPFMDRALTCQAARLIVTGRPADHSYVRPLHFDAALPEKMPWQVAMMPSGSERERMSAERPDASWRDVRTVTFKLCGNYCGIYADAAGSQQVQLVARGDFDGDDVEDLLVRSSNAANGGSYRAIRMFLLTRRQVGSDIELIRELTY